VNSISKEAFDDKMLSIRITWDKRECKARKTAELFDYFNANIAITMKDRMLLSVRRNAGLGDNFYYNNASESMNDRIKKRIRQNKRDAEPSGKTDTVCSLSEIVDVYKEIVNECRRNIHRAVIDLGPYKLDESVAHVKVTAEKCREMSDSQKERVIKIIDPVYKNKDDKEEEELASHRTQKNVMGSFENSGLPSTFAESWNKANLILGRKGVNEAPATTKTKIVMSIGNPEAPHLVTGKEKWKNIKCNCKGFDKNSLCHHILAVAQTEGTLEHIVSNWIPNLSKQVRQGASKQVGQKPGPKRKRHAPTQRNVSSFKERTGASVNCPQEEKFSVVG
jgi:hypothetical protein